MKRSGAWSVEVLTELGSRPFRTSRVSHQQRRCIAERRFAPNDVILLRESRTQDPQVLLTRPLRHGGTIDTHKGSIHHDDIIGKFYRDVVAPRSKNGFKPGSRATQFRCTPVPLDDYVRLSRRMVTPIYPADAGLIVSLLDLHPEPSPVSPTPPGTAPSPTIPDIQILEAGTGHGALTLYLSRAIHAANCSVSLPSSSFSSPSTGSNTLSAKDWKNWKSQRQAVVHTIEVNPKYAAHAEEVVLGFRKGLYARNIDFHVGDVSAWLLKNTPKRHSTPHGESSSPDPPKPGHNPEAFLTHAFLDLPSADKHVAAVARALRTDGTLIVFNPSITQITQCLTYIRDNNLPLTLERVVELGLNGASGGRDWDVRFVRPRASTSSSSSDEPTSESSIPSPAAESLDPDQDPLAISELRVAPGSPHDGLVTVCRPKVGERITGGGFLGVWKRQRD